MHAARFDDEIYELDEGLVLVGAVPFDPALERERQLHRILLLAELDAIEQRRRAHDVWEFGRRLAARAIGQRQRGMACVIGRPATSSSRALSIATCSSLGLCLPPTWTPPSHTPQELARNRRRWGTHLSTGDRRLFFALLPLLALGSVARGADLEFAEVCMRVGGSHILMRRRRRAERWHRGHGCMRVWQSEWRRCIMDHVR